MPIGKYLAGAGTRFFDRLDTAMQRRKAEPIRQAQIESAAQKLTAGQRELDEEQAESERQREIRSLMRSPDYLGLGKGERLDRLSPLLSPSMSGQFAGQQAMQEAGAEATAGRQEAGFEQQDINREDTQEFQAEESQKDRDLRERLALWGMAAREKAAEEKAKSESKKTAKETKGLVDVDNIFGELKKTHDAIATGPVAGRVGRLNVSSPERAKFKATRSFLLKSIARAFEGARMSDIDMTFYNQMIPNDFHTADQFDSMRDAITNLVKWRINSFNETGEDPGATPETGDKDQSGKQGYDEGTVALAKEALNDPEADENDKAVAREILRNAGVSDVR